METSASEKQHILSWLSASEITNVCKRHARPYLQFAVAYVGAGGGQWPSLGVTRNFVVAFTVKTVPNLVSQYSVKSFKMLPDFKANIRQIRFRLGPISPDTVQPTSKERRDGFGGNGNYRRDR